MLVLEWPIISADAVEEPAAGEGIPSDENDSLFRARHLEVVAGPQGPHSHGTVLARVMRPGQVHPLLDVGRVWERKEKAEAGLHDEGRGEVPEDVPLTNLSVLRNCSHSIMSFSICSRPPAADMVLFAEQWVPLGGKEPRANRAGPFRHVPSPGGFAVLPAAHCLSAASLLLAVHHEAPPPFPEKNFKSEFNGQNGQIFRRSKNAWEGCPRRLCVAEGLKQERKMGDVRCALDRLDTSITSKLLGDHGEMFTLRVSCIFLH